MGEVESTPMLHITVSATPSGLPLVEMVVPVDPVTSKCSYSLAEVAKLPLGTYYWREVLLVEDPQLQGRQGGEGQLDMRVWL